MEEHNWTVISMISFRILQYKVQYIHSDTHMQTHTVPAFQHGPSLDDFFCRSNVESPDFSSVETQFIRQYCPLKTKQAGNFLQCLQVNYSILEKKENLSISIKYL